MPFERSSGLLLHISSLPSYGGIGDLGPAAYAFADFLSAGKQRHWQVLPLGPTGFGNSPYASISAFAGNPLLISLEKLVEARWIARERISGLPGHAGNVRFDEVDRNKKPLLAEAARHFLGNHDSAQWERFQSFRAENAFWLNDYALYSRLREHFGSASWHSWPKEFSRRDPRALRAFEDVCTPELECEKAIQFAFDEQWTSLRAYCGERSIRFIGDVAIFVSYDSADVWTHPEIFDLDQNLIPIHISGVPPDYFSATGQRWGNPLYQWGVLERRGFDWWVDRIRRARALYDSIRLDHFRGFEAFWQIPAEDETAVGGRWIKGPGATLFAKLRDRLGEISFIAEDLGMITAEVEALREELGMPGMRVMQFGFGSRGAHIHLPHRYDSNTVAYTGTHDNDTTVGWWRHGISEEERSAVRAYLNPAEKDVAWSMIRASAGSVADVCLIPVQDVLSLGSEARMNRPASPDNNWTWRMAPEALDGRLAEALRDLAEVTDRGRAEQPA